MKISIYSKLVAGAWGGGNQFLKALKKELLARGCYTDNLNEAHAVIYNSYQDSFALIRHFFSFRKAKIVYRLGPVFYLHRGLKWKVVDVFVLLIANLFSDLIIFQSRWSYEQAQKLGLNKKKKYEIIPNAVDSQIFFKVQKGKNVTGDRWKLIYTSWSSNINKGFDYLDFLDKNLDFKKFSMVFIGNSPYQFKNIEVIKPLASQDLAERLRQSDIYISPAKNDACSNAILEALACGLPVVALDSGANRELVNNAGLFFTEKKELINELEQISRNLDFYRSKIFLKGLEKVGDEYILAIKNLCVNVN